MKSKLAKLVAVLVLVVAFAAGVAAPQVSLALDGEDKTTDKEPDSKDQWDCFERGDEMCCVDPNTGDEWCVR